MLEWQKLVSCLKSKISQKIFFPFRFIRKRFNTGFLDFHWRMKVWNCCIYPTAHSRIHLMQFGSSFVELLKSRKPILYVNMSHLLKGCVRYIFASLVFKSKGEHLGNKEIFSLQKLFSFPRKPNFRILDTQISWRHQMPKYKTRNTVYWITREVNIVC